MTYQYEAHRPCITSELLWKLTILTKFQVHREVYTNMTSDNPWMTFKKLELEIATLHLYYVPSFITKQQFILMGLTKVQNMQMSYLISKLSDGINTKLCPSIIMGIIIKIIC